MCSKQLNFWDKMPELAKEFLGESHPGGINFSEISTEINRPNGISERLGEKSERIEHDISDIEVLPEYKFILKAIEEKCPAIFVTGRAGTGKSTLIRYLTSTIKRSVVVAPTAIAAMNVEGSTIHSFFGFPARTLNPDESFSPRKYLLPTVENMDVLIIDEVSMVSPDLVDCMSNSLMKIKDNNLPFGGVPVVFVGDILQLPPVVSDKSVGVYFSHRYDSLYFYSAEVFSKIDILPIELRKVFRQKDPAFIEMLDSIRTNRNHRDSVAHLNRECYLVRKDQKHSDALYLVPTNAAAKSINYTELEKLDTELFTFDAVYDGELRAGQIRFPAPDKLHLKVGATVIFVKNNKPFWLNGTIGEVVSIQDESLNVKIAETGNIVSVTKESWKKLRYSYNYAERKIEHEKIGTFTQFPVSLGWAITIHKSQGMTLDNVCIDLGRGSFCSGQTYVALSRCRTMNGITLKKPLSMSDVKADATVTAFYKRLGFKL